MLRLEDATDNDGRGWRQLTEDELASFIYMALRLAPKGVRNAYVDLNASKVAEAVRALSKLVAARLSHYPTFGPDRQRKGHSTSQGG